MNKQIYDTDDTLRQFARLIDMFRALSNYTRDLQRELTDRGLPLQRPLFFHYEDDEQSQNIQYQYLYGRDLLVAPVLRPGVDEWSVYLPSDTWTHLYDESAVFVGAKWVNVTSPVGWIPVFYRTQSVWVETFRQVAAVANGKTNVLNCKNFNLLHTFN